MLAIDSFRLNQVRFALTALGMVIGTASLILVVTIGLSGRRYVLTSIQNIGTNLVWAEYAGLTDASIASAARFPDSRRHARRGAASSRHSGRIAGAEPAPILHQWWGQGTRCSDSGRESGIRGYTPAGSGCGPLLRSAGLIDPQSCGGGHGEICFDPVRQCWGSGRSYVGDFRGAIRHHRRFSRAGCDLRAVGDCR